MSDMPNPYQDTMNLPATAFAMRAELPKREPAWIARTESDGVYRTLLQRSAKLPPFILHCGPPYANGNFHMGHALSYLLKDFIVRAKFMTGHYAPFVPGWDCHGLPIEWKVEQDLTKAGIKKADLTKPQIREKCRAEADHWFKLQREEWRRFGVLADFDHPYRTMDFANEADTIRALGELVATGTVYKGAKSVNWSTVEQTALAEAEIEYKDVESTAVYVAFPVVGKQNEFVVIWTTTPWTLPANRAVAYGRDIEYQLVRYNAPNSDKEIMYWFAHEKIEQRIRDSGLAEVGANFKGLKVVRGADYFAGLKLHHPFYPTRHVPMVEGFHVTTDAGTGFVHTAPAHGAEDFEIGKQFGLNTDCPVKGDGTYEDGVDTDADTLRLAGKDIWKAQPDILAELEQRGVLLKQSKFQHSYPVSWRSKAKLIFRTTPQWFVRMGDAADPASIRAKALKAIFGGDVHWIPEVGKNRIGGMIEGRPDWCISRQRAWGVPIAIFRNKKTGEYLFDRLAFEHVARHVEKMGVDAWDKLSVDELLAGYDYTGGSKADLEKETDILDVWFDSGTTWHHVLQARQDLRRSDGNVPADMYLEGSDQHRGWFHTSLLTSVAITGKAPYAQVLTHGFVVDGDGRKMSKSLGNVISPKEIIEKYGADVLRLWVAASDYREDVRLSPQIMESVVDSYRRLRNTFRYMLGNLHDFTEAQAVPYADLPELEKWVLATFHDLMTSVRDGYDTYQFHRVYHALHDFCAVELSALYFDIRKDALYADAKNAPRRRACQTVLMHLLKGLTTSLAPLIPFTADEVWRAAFGESAESVHLRRLNAPDAAWKNPALLEKWQRVLEVRAAVNAALERDRQAGKIGKSLEADVALGLPEPMTFDRFSLEELLIVSHVDVAKAAELSVAIVPAAGHKCPRCWVYARDIGAHATHSDVCGRCGDALQANAAAAA